MAIGCHLKTGIQQVYAYLEIYFKSNGLLPTSGIGFGISVKYGDLTHL